MDACYAILDKIRSALTLLKQNPKTQRRFPRSLWASIVWLTKTISVNPFCGTKIRLRQDFLAIGKNCWCNKFWHSIEFTSQDIF